MGSRVPIARWGSKPGRRSARGDDGSGANARLAYAAFEEVLNKSEIFVLVAAVTFDTIYRRRAAR